MDISWILRHPEQHS